MRAGDAGYRSLYPRLGVAGHRTEEAGQARDTQDAQVSLQTGWGKATESILPIREG